MLTSKMKTLIESLINKTANGSAVWNKTSRETEFFITLDSGKITTDRFSGSHDEAMIDFAIYNTDGNRILYEYLDKNDRPADYTFLDSLYEAVMRKYYRVDETLENIEKEVNSSKILGAKKDDADLPF